MPYCKCLVAINLQSYHKYIVPIDRCTHYSGMCYMSYKWIHRNFFHLRKLSFSKLQCNNQSWPCCSEIFNRLCHLSHVNSLVTCDF